MIACDGLCSVSRALGPEGLARVLGKALELELRTELGIVHLGAALSHLRCRGRRRRGRGSGSAEVWQHVLCDERARVVVYLRVHEKVELVGVERVASLTADHRSSLERDGVLPPRVAAPAEALAPSAACVVTLHALERYIERFEPRASLEDARDALLRLWAGAVHVGATPDALRYRDPNYPAAELLVRCDPDGSYAILTVVDSPRCVTR